MPLFPVAAVGSMPFFLVGGWCWRAAPVQRFSSDVLRFIDGRSIDDLVKLTSVKPYTPALRAIVDFDSLSFSDHQIHATDWTFHLASFLS